MAAKQELQIKILNDHGVMFEGAGEALLVPGARDVVAIMPFHTPLIMLLGKGDIVMVEGRKRQVLASVRSGLAYVGNNEASVLINA